jgi:NusA-like KH domain protein
MLKIKYDQALITTIALFGSKTDVNAKDAFEDVNGILYFIVDQGNASKAIGKEGVNVKKLSLMLNKKIKIVEFSNERETFIKRLIFPLKVSEITSNGNLVIIKGIDKETNSRIIGRNAVHLRDYENMVRRYFPLDEIKVIS